MNFNIEDDSRIYLEGKNWILGFICEWYQLFHTKTWNWFDITIIKLDFMIDRMLPGFEFNFIVLGCGIYLRINGDWNKTETGRDLNEIKSTLDMLKEKDAEIVKLKDELEKYKIKQL